MKSLKAFLGPCVPFFPSTGVVEADKSKKHNNMSSPKIGTGLTVKGKPRSNTVTKLRNRVRSVSESFRKRMSWPGLKWKSTLGAELFAKLLAKLFTKHLTENCTHWSPQLLPRALDYKFSLYNCFFFSQVVAEKGTLLLKNLPHQDIYGEVLSQYSVQLRLKSYLKDLTKANAYNVKDKVLSLEPHVDFEDRNSVSELVRAFAEKAKKAPECQAILAAIMKIFLGSSISKETMAEAMRPWIDSVKNPGNPSEILWGLWLCHLIAQELLDSDMELEIFQAVLEAMKRLDASSQHPFTIHLLALFKVIAPVFRKRETAACEEVKKVVAIVINHYYFHSGNKETAARLNRIMKLSMFGWTDVEAQKQKEIQKQEKDKQNHKRCKAWSAEYREVNTPWRKRRPRKRTISFSDESGLGYVQPCEQKARRRVSFQAIIENVLL